MAEKVSYFAYGANMTGEMMEAITGNSHLVGKPATIKDYELGVQKLNQVPDSVSPNAPKPISPRAILEEEWDRNFETYVIRPAKGKEVKGTLWELTPLERELVRNWELVDFGWYKDEKVKVRLDDGTEVEAQTEILGDGQDIDRIVEEGDYNRLLMSLEDFQRIAEKARKEFLEGVRNKEGATGSSEQKM